MTAPGGSSRASVARHATWLAAGRVASQVLAVVLTVVLARGLGTVGFGQYAFVGAIIVIANMITTFGTDSLLIREFAGGRVDPGRLLTSALALQLVLSLVCIVFIAGGAGWLPGRSADTVTALRIYALALLPLAFYSVFSAALRGWERMDLYAQLTIGTAGLQTVAAVAAVLVRARLSDVVVALLLAQVGAALLGWWLCRVARPAFTVGHWSARIALGVLIGDVWPLALLSGLAVVTQRIGVVLLSFLAGDAPAGWFSAAARVVEGLKLAHYAVQGGMLPVASRLAAREAFEDTFIARTAFAEMVRGSLAILVAISAVAAVAATLVAGPIVTLLYGRAYGPAIDALRLLAWTLIPTAVAGPLSLAFVSEGRERIALRIAVLALAVTIGLGLWLIPRAGLQGACVAVLIGETVRTVSLVVATRRVTRS